MSDNGMDELMSALSTAGPRRVETVSDSYAGDGLVRLIVRSDASISVEIDPYAAEEASTGEIERHLLALFTAASIPDPSKSEPSSPPAASNETRPREQPGRYPDRMRRD